MNPVKEYISYQNIVDHLDITEGDTVVIASDITRIAIQAGRKEGQFDADKFLDSFQRKLGNNGTILIPAYNFNFRKDESFSVKATAPTTGALALLAFRRKDFIRTYNPLHSFMVWGKHANEFASLRNHSSFGHDSPFALMQKLNAKMLFAGTSIADAFTFTHFIEETEKVKYRKYRKIRLKYTDSDNISSQKEFLFYNKKAGWDMKLRRIQDVMESQKDISALINGVNFTLVDAEFAGHIITADIRNNRGRNIAAFSMKLCLKEEIKNLLSDLSVYRTTREKIDHASHL